MQYILMFLEGIITFISPCLLSMLPIYISYFAANEANKKKALTNSIGFVLGFTIVFVIMGAFMGTVGKLIRNYKTILNIVTGSIVIIIGLNFLGILKIGFLNRIGKKNMVIKNLEFFSSMVFGIVFSINWTPCVGTF